MDLKTVMMDAANAAGEIIQIRFQTAFQVDSKSGINDLVTEVDKEAETAIIDIIRVNFPTHTIISEEAGTDDQQSEFQWIIDPIDGTVNFAHGIPLCCVSIGLQQGEELILGAVYNPMMNEFFFAEKGGGAFLNGKPIHVSAKEDFARACLVTGFPYQWPADQEHPIKTFERIVMLGLPVRRLGSAAMDLCWVACGRFDGFWEYNLNSWDIAAGYLIVAEAGGKITNFKGEKAGVFDKETVATNGHIHEALLDQINKKD